ncbi:hypothetical protein AMK59_4134, partial [Oryctes borbonicus]
ILIIASSSFPDNCDNHIYLCGFPPSGMSLVCCPGTTQQRDRGEYKTNRAQEVFIRYCKCTLIEHFKMKLSVIFVFVLMVLAAFMGQTDARSKRLRKLEKRIKKIFEETKEALPVVQGVIGVVKAVGKR